MDGAAGPRRQLRPGGRVVDSGPQGGGRGWPSARLGRSPHPGVLAPAGGTRHLLQRSKPSQRAAPGPGRVPLPPHKGNMGPRAPRSRGTTSASSFLSRAEPGGGGSPASIHSHPWARMQHSGKLEPSPIAQLSATDRRFASLGREPSSVCRQHLPSGRVGFRAVPKRHGRVAVSLQQLHILTPGRTEHHLSSAHTRLSTVKQSPTPASPEGVCGRGRLSVNRGGAEEKGESNLIFLAVIPRLSPAKSLRL